MKKATKVTLGVIFLAVLGYLVSFLIPAPASWSSDLPTFKWTLANSILYTLLHIGAAVLFMAAVNTYKAGLKKAYAAIASGIVLVGVGLAQVVFINVFGLLQTPWVEYGGVMLPFVAAGLAIYFGVRAMAKLVGASSPLTNLWIVLPFLVVSVIVAGLLPHVASPLPELYFDISNAISVWDVVLYGASLGLVLHIKKLSGAHYTESMAWLALGLTGSVAITTYILIGTYSTGIQPGGYVLDAAVVLGGLLYIKAGHSFVKTEEL